jgi:hypothetical protein
MDKADSPSAGDNHIKTVNRAAVPARSGPAKVSAAVFAKVPSEPRPKDPNPDVIRAVVEMKQRNPTWGCPRIAEQISLAFGIPIN